MRSIRDCCGNQPRASAKGCAAEACKAGDPGRHGERNRGARNAWRMIGLDTNVVVRYFAQDHEQQSAHASALIESLTGEEPGFISIVALIELVWVMQGAYKASKAEIVKILQQLLQTREIIVQDAEVVLQALSRFADSKAGFADCLISALGIVTDAPPPPHSSPTLPKQPGCAACHGSDSIRDCGLRAGSQGPLICSAISACLTFA